jgi:hypothetical protein
MLLSSKPTARLISSRLFFLALLVATLPPSTPLAQSFVPPTNRAVCVDPIHGSDTHADGSAERPYATIYKGVKAAWQTVQTNVKASTITLLYFDAAVQWAVGADSLPVTSGTAVLIVDQGDLIASYPDALLYVRLESLGFHVTLVTDNDLPNGKFTVADALTHDLVVITESASSSSVAPLIAIDVPVINMRGDSWSGWYMCGIGSTNRAVGTQLTIIDETSTLAAGTTGTVTVYNEDWIISYADRSSLTTGATPVATLAGDPDRVCLFSIDTDAELTSGAAPARRVGFFLFARPRTVDGVNYVFMEDDTALYPEVLVAEGTLSVEESIYLKYRTRVRGGWDATFQQQDPDKYVTTLDGQNRTHMFEVQTYRSAGCWMEGLSFVNGWRDDPVRGGGAIYADPDGYLMDGIVIDRCKFINNRSVFEGGALYVEDWNGEFSITDCVFMGNSAPNGLVISTSQDSILTIERCLFADNVATTIGRNIIYFPDANARLASIFNCVFANNVTVGSSSHIIELNGARYDFNRHRLYNNTFYNNRTNNEIVYDNSGEGGVYQSRIDILSNLFVNNICNNAEPRPVFQRRIADASGSRTRIAGNLVHGNMQYEVINPSGNAPLIQVGVNAIDGNPSLHHPAAGDFRLNEDSAAIDVGIELWGYFLGDFAGAPRPMGMGFDIGAFESDGSLRNGAGDWRWYR